MRKRRRSRLLLSLASLAVVVGVVGLGARRTGWLPARWVPRPVADFLDSGAEPPSSSRGPLATADPFAEDATTKASADNIDQMIFESQTEPAPNAIPWDERPLAAAERSTASNGQEAGTSRWADPVLPAIAPSLPMAGSQLRSQPPQWTANGPASESAGPIIQVGHEEAVDVALPHSAPQPTSPTASPAPKPNATASRTQVDLTAIDNLIRSGRELEAHRELSRIYWQQPESRSIIQDRIRETAQRIYFSAQPHYVAPYVVQPGDQLRKIAKMYDVTWEYVARLNHVDPRRIRAGQKLKVFKGPFSVLVDLSDFELTVHGHGYFVRSYRVGAGKDGATPIGTFAVLNKVVNPQYTDPEGRVIDGNDPANPLGERWIDIGDGFGIHGTIEPDSIGRAVSRGCLRMRNEDVAELYDFLTVGSEVVIQR